MNAIGGHRVTIEELRARQEAMERDVEAERIREMEAIVRFYDDLEKEWEMKERNQR